MPQRRGTPEGNYEIEIDGIDVFRALTVSGGNEDTAAIGIPDGGNSNREHKVVGSVTVEDLTIEVAAGMWENALDQIRQWRRDVRERSVSRRTIRRVLFDESG